MGLSRGNWTDFIYAHTHRVQHRQSQLQVRLVGARHRVVLEIGHEIPPAGHLGKEKTRQRITRRPTVFKDINEYYKSCAVCQKSSIKKVPRAPLIPLPIISETFQQIAMDIVGPLPRSHLGNKYILVLCDYATRYPEAIPLRCIDAIHVAEDGFCCARRDFDRPREQRCLCSLGGTLLIAPHSSDPYQPLPPPNVERFNQMLKSMLRKVVSTEGKDWDKWIPYLLFAYRQVPQASTGFSSFELLYGCNVRG